MITEETFTLNSGVKIPHMALGVWEISDAQVGDAVKSALKLGYRHIDTAQAYGNEAGVGKAVNEVIKSTDLKRDDIFINSKVAAEIKDYKAAKASIDETLDKMNLDYLDMMIIHNPQPWNEVNQSSDRHFEGNLETWRAMEDAVKEGKLRTIGVSSFLKEDLDNIINNSSTVPAVNQILCHIGATDLDTIKYSQDKGIVVEAFSPIAHGAALNDEDVKKVAKKYGVTPAQLCLRYDWQLNTVILPKSANPEHMKSNLDIDFEISDEDMETLKHVQPVDYGQAGVFPVFGGKI